MGKLLKKVTFYFLPFLLINFKNFRQLTRSASELAKLKFSGSVIKSLYMIQFNTKNPIRMRVCLERGGGDGRSEHDDFQVLGGM